MMWLCVWLRMCIASLAQFSPAGPGAVFKAAFLASVPQRRQDWRAREKEPATEEEWDWTFAKQPQLGASIHFRSPPQQTFFHIQYPLSTSTAFISGREAITDCPALQHVACCFGFGTVQDCFIGGALAALALSRKWISQFVTLSNGTNHRSVFSP